MDSLQNTRYAIQRIIDANDFKVGDDVKFIDGAFNTTSNDSNPYIDDIIFIIDKVRHQKNKTKETKVDLRFDEIHAHYYDIYPEDSKGKSYKVVSEGSYKIDNIPISLITKEV